MKCKKYDQKWFDNKYIQLLKLPCSKEEKIKKLIVFMNFSKEKGIIPKHDIQRKEEIKNL